MRGEIALVVCRDLANYIDCGDTPELGSLIKSCPGCYTPIVHTQESMAEVERRGIDAIIVCWRCAKIAAGHIRPDATVEVKFGDAIKTHMRDHPEVRDEASDLFRRMKKRPR